MLTSWFWNAIARTLAKPRVAAWLIRRAQRTPYFHLVKRGEVYMYRWWLFNPYDHETRKRKYPWVPFSVRVHRIMKPDDDRHLHDHPWNARTVILRGSYIEETPATMPGSLSLPAAHAREQHYRVASGTHQLRPGQYHRITHVTSRGAYTLFITGKNQSDWGFLVDGKKIPWKEYLGIKE